MSPSRFEDKLLSKINKLDPEEISALLTPLLAHKTFMQTLLDHLNEGVIVTDSDMTLVFANAKGVRMLGLPAGKNLVGENLVERMNPNHPVGETILSLRQNWRAIDHYECVFGPKQDRILSLTTLPMRTPNEQATREDVDVQDLMLLILQDVTERHRHHDEQVRAKRLASLAMLTSGVAHEIKNPLNALNIHAQLLKGEVSQARQSNQPLDLDKVDRACGVILEETARLNRTVADFIQAARPRTPQLESRPLQPILEQAREAFGAECDRLGVELTFSVEPDLPPLMLDEHLLLQVLRNLVHNALDAFEEQMRRQTESERMQWEPRIAIVARLGTDSVDLIVRDNGPGIPDEALEHIFEPYYTTKFSGSGLGLMVVFRGVTEHRGSIHVDTQPAEGTTFTISLPLEQRPVRLLESTPAEEKLTEIEDIITVDVNGHVKADPRNPATHGEPEIRTADPPPHTPDKGVDPEQT